MSKYWEGKSLDDLEVGASLNNQGFLNEGVLIIREKDTMTDSVSSTIFKEICKTCQLG